MSHSDKDDFEKDPFGESGFGNDPFSENGKENDSGQSGDEPSFDELFGNFQSSGSESLDSFDFDDAASGDRKDSPKGEDGAGNDFFADLLNDSSDSPKEDTLAGLAGLENLMGGDRNAAEDTASRLDALKPEGDGVSPNLSEDGADFDFDFDTADGGSGAAPESSGGLDLDFSDLSAEGDAPAAGDDTASRLGDLEDLLGGSDAGSTAADADAGLDSDFFKNLQVGDGDSPASAEVGSDLKPEFPDFADAPESGEGGIDFDFSDLSAEGESSAPDVDAGLDSDFFKNLQVGDGDSPASAEGGSDLKPEFPDFADAPKSVEWGIDFDFSDLSAEGDVPAAGAESGLDSDFFKNLQVGDGDSPAAAEGGVSELKPELPDFADAPESGGAAESAPDADFDFDFAAPESAGAAGEPSASEEFDLDSNVIGGFGDDSLRASEEAPTEEGSKDPFDFPQESDDDFLKDLEGEDVFDVSRDENAGTDAESPASGIDFSDAASDASFAGENEHPLEDVLGAPSEKSGAEPSLDDLLGGEIGAPDDTAARLGGLEDMLGSESSDDTAARLGSLSAESGGEGELDPDFFGGSAEESGAARNDQTDGEFPFDDAEDGIDTKTVPADADGGDDFPAFDDEGTDEFAALNTGDSGEGESTTAALAGFEGLVSSDGPAAGDDTAALLGALTGEGEPAKDESTTAGLAGLENLLGSGDDRDEETAVRLSHLADEQEEDESPDERSLDDILTDGDAASESGAADFPAFDDAGFGDEFGIGAGDDSAPADDLSEFTGEGGGFGDEFGAVPAEDATAEEEEEESAESGKGKKKKKEKGPKKEKSRRRRKQEQLDPVSKLLVIPQVFFIVYMILGNIKGILEWHGKGAEFFTLPFFLLAFNGTGFVLFLLPALLRAFRKRYAEDTKLTEYTLFMFMLAMAVAAMIMACHPLIFDLARNWGGPH